MGRKKVLTKRVYTFEQLSERWARWRKREVRAAAGKWAGFDCPMRGSIVLTSHYTKHCMILKYKSKRFSFDLAYVYRASDGDTVYEVFGVGHAAAARLAPKPDEREKELAALCKALRRYAPMSKLVTSTKQDQRKKQLAAWRKAWRRYAPMFTPVEPAPALGAITAYYRLHDGVATACGRVDGTGHDPQGVWLSRTAVYSTPSPDEWTKGWDTYPNFPRRAIAFFTTLRQEVPNAGLGEVKPLHSDACKHFDSMQGVCMEVCSPPSRHRNGRRLLVKMSMYNKEGRQFHHVDGDYAPQHSQFFALEDGKPRSQMIRWKCAADAIIGIKEWAIGDIFIPGPG